MHTWFKTNEINYEEYFRAPHIPRRSQKQCAAYRLYGKLVMQLQ